MDEGEKTYSLVITTTAKLAYFDLLHYWYGNIETQLRKNGSGDVIDSLTYRYEDGDFGRKRNRLYHVNDAEGDLSFDDDIDDMGAFDDASANINSNNNYRYDELGQLVADNQEGIAGITWRNDGKISSIQRGSGSTAQELFFSYDPAETA